MYFLFDDLIDDQKLTMDCKKQRKIEKWKFKKKPVDLMVQNGKNQTSRNLTNQRNGSEDEHIE